VQFTKYELHGTENTVATLMQRILRPRRRFVKRSSPNAPGAGVRFN
jgi:hypothetical protein